MCHAVLCCRALSNPQEDCAPPRPPLPESYEPDPPAIPPLPSSRAGLRPSSLHRPEDRKTNHRNGSSSVSSLTSDLTADPTRPPLCHHTSLLAVSLFTFNFHQSLMFSWEVLLWITFWFAPSHFFHHQLFFVFYQQDKTSSAKYQSFFVFSFFFCCCLVSFVLKIALFCCVVILVAN